MLDIFFLAQTCWVQNANFDVPCGGFVKFDSTNVAVATPRRSCCQKIITCTIVCVQHGGAVELVCEKCSVPEPSAAKYCAHTDAQPTDRPSDSALLITSSAVMADLQVGLNLF